MDRRVCGPETALPFSDSAIAAHRVGRRQVMLKTALVLISLAAVSFAADPQTNRVKDPAVTAKPNQVKRLGSIHWDLETHKLSWVVQKGSMVGDEFVADSEQHYEISPDDAVMIAAEEQRGFDGDEAASLHHLLDVLSLYCAESVVWWDQGQGRKLDDTEKTTPERKKKEPEPNREKVDEKPFPSPNTPKPNVASLDMVYSSEGQAAQRSFTAAAR